AKGTDLRSWPHKGALRPRSTPAPLIPHVRGVRVMDLMITREGNHLLVHPRSAPGRRWIRKIQRLRRGYFAQRRDVAVVGFDYLGDFNVLIEEAIDGGLDVTSTLVERAPPQWRRSWRETAVIN